MKSAERRKPKTDIKNIIVSETGKCGNGPHRNSRKVTQQEESQAAVLLSDQLGLVSRGKKYLQGVGCCRGVGSAKEQKVMKR